MFLLSCGTKEEPIKLLILSGSNNHEWQNTTPFLPEGKLLGTLPKAKLWAIWRQINGLSGN